MGRSAVVVAVLGIAATIAVGVAAFMVGKSSVDESSVRSSAFSQGYDKGLSIGTRDGVERGATRERAKYEKGEPAYQDIWRSGYRSGRGAGRSDGYAAGKASGQETGENLAFSGFGGWTTNAWYIVHITDGSEIGSNASYGVESRVGPMKSDDEYWLCPDGDGICGNR